MRTPSSSTIAYPLSVCTANAACRSSIVMLTAEGNCFSTERTRNLGSLSAVARTCSRNARFSNLLTSSPLLSTLDRPAPGSMSSSIVASALSLKSELIWMSQFLSELSPSSFADWYATVEAKYLSQITAAPPDTSLPMRSVWSLRSATNSSASVLWDMAPAAPERMNAPIPSWVGSAVTTVLTPLASSSLATLRQTVDFPAPSIPSNTMKTPLIPCRYASLK